MKTWGIPLMIVNWCWYLATIINNDFGYEHYLSLILGIILTTITFSEYSK